MPSVAQRGGEAQQQSQRRWSEDYTYQEALRIALTLGIDDEIRVRSALNALEYADGLSRRENVSLKEALGMVLRAQAADPLYLRVRAVRDWWKKLWT
jgi:hypothetical protein